MIKYVTGDIFKSDVEAIVNTVNTEGIMGKGLALQFKKRFPDNFKAYEKFCKDGLLFVGNMFIFPTNALSGPRYIINFPTKKSWKNKSKIEDPPRAVFAGAGHPSLENSFHCHPTSWLRFGWPVME